MKNSTQRSRSFLATAKSAFMLILLGLLSLYIYKHRADFTIIGNIQLGYLVPVVFFIALGQVVVSYVFHLLLTFIAHSLSFFITFKYLVLGRFLNKFVPFGGGIYRVVMFKKEANISYLKSISTLVTFSWLNVLVSLAVGIGVIAFTDPLLHFQKVPILVFFIFLLFLQQTLLVGFSYLLKKFPATATASNPDTATPPALSFSQIFSSGADILARLVAVMKNRPLLLKLFSFIFIDLSFNMIVLYYLFLSLGVQVTLSFLILLVVTMRLSTVIEITPGNLGVREFVYGFLAGGMGQTIAQGIIVSILFRFIGGVTQGIISLVLIVLDPRPTHPKKTESATPKSVFLLAPSLPFRGGIAHYNTLLYNHLRQRGEVMFYTFKKQYFQWLFPGKTDKDPSVDKIQLENGGPCNPNNPRDGIKRTLHPLNLFSWFKAGRAARSYSLVLLPWWVIFWAPYYLLFLGIVRFRNPRTKIIFMCHNVTEHERVWTGWLKKVIAQLVLQRADYFILHSRHQERQLALLLKDKMKPARVSPHPHYQVFNKNRYTVQQAREILEIPVPQRVVLFFGFIRKYKGLEYLLKALPLVKAYDPDILLLIVGEVWGHPRHYLYYQQMIQQLGISNNIRFLNRYVLNEEVELYFKASDFAVLPYIDGSGSGILQVAYGMDKPVVATRVGAFEEVVDEGRTGWLVTPGDEEQLAQAIVKMYTSSCLPAMAVEVSQYKKRFAWSQMVDCIWDDF